MQRLFCARPTCFATVNESMDVLYPKSWTSLEFHPYIVKLGFSNWRKHYLETIGDDPLDDPDHVLAVTRYVCESIHDRIEGLTTKLVALDSVEFNVEISGCGIDGQIGYCDGETVYIYLFADETPDKQIIADLVPKGIAAEIILKEFELKERQIKGAGK